MWSDNNSQKKKHDIWLTDAAQYIASSSWSAPKITINNGEALGKLYDAEKKIRQAAYDGDLPIWGMDNFSGPLKLIPKDYWARYGFEMMGILGNHEEWRTEHREGARDQSIFHSLKTTKEKVEKL